MISEEEEEFDGSTVDALTIARQLTEEAAGKFIVIVGASLGGIGFEIARAIAKSGAELFVCCRTDDSCKKAISAIQGEFQLSQPIQSHVLDLASFASIQRCADHLISLGRGIDVLIHNAGTMEASTKVTEDGFERQWQVNYLGPFYLTQLLLPALISAGTRERPSRVITTSSIVNYLLARDGTATGIDYDTLINFCKAPKDSLRRYAESKLAVIMFAKEFSRRMAEELEEMEAEKMTNEGTNSERVIEKPKDKEKEKIANDREDRDLPPKPPLSPCRDTEIEMYIRNSTYPESSSIVSPTDISQASNGSGKKKGGRSSIVTPTNGVVIAVCVNPGLCRGTRLRQSIPVTRFLKIGWQLMMNGTAKLVEKQKHKTLSEAAATTVYCALHPSGVQAGKYYADCLESDLVHPDALKPNAWKKLWDMTERQIGERLTQLYGEPTEVAHVRVVDIEPIERGTEYGLRPTTTIEI